MNLEGSVETYESLKAKVDALFKERAQLSLELKLA